MQKKDLSSMSVATADSGDCEMDIQERADAALNKMLGEDFEVNDTRMVYGYNDKFLGKW